MKKLGEMYRKHLPKSEIIDDVAGHVGDDPNKKSVDVKSEPKYINIKSSRSYEVRIRFTGANHIKTFKTLNEAKIYRDKLLTEFVKGGDKKVIDEPKSEIKIIDEDEL